MFCAEKIINVYWGKNEYPNTIDENYWFDCYHDIAFHTTEGCRLLLETDNFMISLGADGVKIQSKKEFIPYDDEWLEESVEIFEEETESGIERETFIAFENTLFVGERLHSVENSNGCFTLKFDDFSLKLIVYNHGEDIHSFYNKNIGSYNYVLGVDRFIKAKCPLCGGDGEVLLDFVTDYVVRCKSCKKSTYAEMEVIDAIEQWNNGEVLCDLSNITIE